MPVRRSVIPVLATVVTGAALYCSRAVIDIVEIDGAMSRLAFLPGWPTLLGCLGAALLVVTGLGLLSSRPAGGAARPLGELVLPLFASGVLALPYLPVLPDWLPALQALAGPLVGVVWLVVAGLQFWVLAQAGVIVLPAFSHWPLRRVTAVIFAATVVVAGLVAWRLMASPAFPGGDEPHYLVIAQSIWRDGDLDIQNNHARGDYFEYMSMELAPHYLAAGLGGVFYSVHPILMPLLMAPVMALGGYVAVVSVFVLLAAIAATLAWRSVRGTLNAPGAATFAWAAIAGSTPYLLNSFTVYPEICGALAVMIGWSLMVATPRERPGVGRHIAMGLACAALPWLSTKYAPMSAALVLVIFARLWRGDLRAFAREPKAWAVALPYATALAGWFTFFYIFWGNPLPNAPYGAYGQTSPLNLLRGGPGLLFDQEYGLLAFAPAHVLAATGMIGMWRRGGGLRRQAVEIALVFSALLATVGAFWIWWGGSAAPGRPVVSGLLLLALPIAVAFQDAKPGSARRASQYLLLLLGIGIAATLTVAQDGLLIDNGRDGTAALLEYWLPHWSLPTLAPTYTFHEPALAYLHTLCWLAIAGLGANVLSRSRSLSPGANALVAVSVLAGALVMTLVTMPWLPGGPPRPALNLSARSRLAALDGFDANALPTVVVYDPLRTVTPAALVPRLALSVTPGLRADRTPVRLIHNGRFSLPAGSYSIQIDFSSSAAPATMGLQVGRLGGPLESWDLQPRAGEAWHGSFELPVDANFIGLVGPAELESAIAKATIAPTAIVDAGARPQVAAVLAARKYGEATLFFHDENLYPERQGLWTRGDRTASVTVAPPAHRPSSTILTLNSGSRGNTANLSAPGWYEQHQLVPGQVVDLQLPPAVRGVIALTVSATGSYRPRDIDPTSRDPRVLGLWLGLKPR